MGYFVTVSKMPTFLPGPHTYRLDFPCIHYKCTYSLLCYGWFQKPQKNDDQAKKKKKETQMYTVQTYPAQWHNYYSQVS